MSGSRIGGRFHQDSIGRATERILRGEIDYVVYHVGHLVEDLLIGFRFGDFTNDGNNFMSDKMLPF